MKPQDGIQRTTLSSTKTKELMIDYWRHNKYHNQIHIDGDCVAKVPVFKFLGIQALENHYWSRESTYQGTAEITLLEKLPLHCHSASL